MLFTGGDGKDRVLQCWEKREGDISWLWWSGKEDEVRGVGVMMKEELWKR